MKKVLFILLISFINRITSQNKLVTISGKVSDDQDTTIPVFAIKVKLNFNDSSFIETDCDTLGNYKFQLSSALVKNNKLVLSVYQDFINLKKYITTPA